MDSDQEGKRLITLYENTMAEQAMEIERLKLRHTDKRVASGQEPDIQIGEMLQVQLLGVQNTITNI